MKLEDLRANQQRAILSLLDSNSVSEAAKKAEISESRLWEWLKDQDFQEILHKEREMLFQESMAKIKAGTMKATQKLLALLDSADERLQRNVANDLLDKAFKCKELLEFEERLSRLETLYEEKK